MRTFLLNRSNCRRRLTRSITSIDIKPTSLNRSTSLQHDDVYNKESSRSPITSQTDVRKRRQLSRSKTFFVNGDEQMFSRREMMWGPIPTAEKKEKATCRYKIFITPLYWIWEIIITLCNKIFNMSDQQENTIITSLLRYLSITLYCAAFCFVCYYVKQFYWIL